MRRVRSQRAAAGRALLKAHPECNLLLCDDGLQHYPLARDVEADGSPVSWFKTDDYFYFSMGVALSMAEMLEGVK